MEEKKNLPKIQDLYNTTDIEAYYKQDTLNWLLNQQPSKDWLKKNKFANDAIYIPIGVVEMLLQRIFKKIRIEVLDQGQLFNSVFCKIRLHYLDPISNSWEFHDGVGACELQTKQGSGSLLQDFSNIGKGAVEMALPKAKSQAIKDAAEHLGKLFGRDVNRKESLEYTRTVNFEKPINPLNDD